MTHSKDILGLDLSLTNTGYCSLFIEEGKIAYVQFGSVKTKSSDSIGYRLNLIKKQLEHELKHEYDDIVRERSFSNRFILATQQIFKVNGLVEWLVYSITGLDVQELAPTTVKKQITGNGKASKEEVAVALEGYVGEQKYKNNDESDAVAVAVAYAIKKGYLK